MLLNRLAKKGHPHQLSQSGIQTKGVLKRIEQKVIKMLKWKVQSQMSRYRNQFPNTRYLSSTMLNRNGLELNWLNEIIIKDRNQKRIELMTMGLKQIRAILEMPK